MSTVKYGPMSTTIFLSDVFQSPHYNYCYEKIKVILYHKAPHSFNDTIRYHSLAWTENLLACCSTRKQKLKKINRREYKKAVLSQRQPRDARYISRSWAVAEIWPVEIIQDVGGRHFQFIRIENSAIRSAVPEKGKPHPITKHEVDRTTGCGDIATWNFSNMAVAAILDLFES